MRWGRRKEWFGVAKVLAGLEEFLIRYYPTMSPGTAIPASSTPADLYVSFLSSFELSRDFVEGEGGWYVDEKYVR